MECEQRFPGAPSTLNTWPVLCLFSVLVQGKLTDGVLAFRHASTCKIDSDLTQCVGNDALERYTIEITPSWIPPVPHNKTLELPSLLRCALIAAATQSLAP